MALGDEVAIRNEPEAEPEEDDDDDDELEDPQETLKETCQQTAACQAFAAELQVCNDRVNNRSKTEENCMQEVFDFVHCVDHCVGKELFKHVK